MEFTQVRTKAQEMLVKKDNEIKKLRNVNNKSNQKEERSGLEGNGDESDSSDDEDGEKRDGPKNMQQFSNLDMASRAYIKNVLIKYLEYKANSLDKEAMMMEKVLFTVLKVQESEVNVLQAARVAQQNTGLMSYIWAAEESNLVAHPVKPRAYNPGN